MMQNSDSTHTTIVVEDLSAYADKTLLKHFVEQAGYTHYLQSVPWAENITTDDCFYIVSYKNKDIIAASLIRRHRIHALKRNKYFIDRGPVFNAGDALDAHLRDVLALLGKDGLWLRLNPYILPNDEIVVDIYKRHGIQENHHDHASYHATVLIDLQQSQDEIKSGFRRSLRTQLNKASRLDIRVESCCSESEFKIFLDKLNAFRQPRDLAPIEHVQAFNIFQNILNEESKGVLLLAYHQNEIVAGIGLFAANRYLIYEWGYSSDREEHRKLPLSHILHWEGICWAKARAYQYYDFGGYWLERGEADSINRFKNGYSSSVQTVMLPRQKYLSPIGRVADFLSTIRKWVLLK